MINKLCRIEHTYGFNIILPTSDNYVRLASVETICNVAKYMNVSQMYKCLEGQ